MKIQKILAGITVLVALSFTSAQQAQAKNPKYVFYMIGDGMGINQAVGAQIYNNATGNGPQSLNFLEFPVRTFVTTHCATTLVTDSSAAGTALACGVKTYRGATGVDKDTVAVSNICEWAKAAGFGVGIATCVGVNHATPSCFYAHTYSRGNYEEIVRQLTTAKVDFTAGGGFINQKSKTGHDSKYLEQMMTDAGVSILRGEQLKDAASHKERIVCLSSNTEANDLPYYIDHTEKDTQLTDFVKAGIDYLTANFGRKGFFFMIEGGNIDHAGHNDDGVADFQDVNDFAKAIDEVLEFYKKHPKETLIIVTADHETGGLMLGAGEYRMNPERLKVQKCSEVELNRRFREFAKVVEGQEIPSWEKAKEFFSENLGLWSEISVDEKTEAALKDAYEKSFRKNEGNDVVTLYSVSTRVVSNAIDYVNKKAGYTWSFSCHSGSPVGLYVKGAGEKEFISCHDNTDIPLKTAEVAGYKLFE